MQVHVKQVFFNDDNRGCKVEHVFINRNSVKTVKTVWFFEIALELCCLHYRCIKEQEIYPYDEHRNKRNSPDSYGKNKKNFLQQNLN